MKRALLFLGAFIVLLLAAALAIPFLIDANQFRPMLETRLTQALGREVKLGNLKLSLLQGSVEAQDVSIADDPAFAKSPFLKTRALQIQVEMSPLIFSRELVVTGIKVEEPEIILIQSAKGTWNVSTMGGPSANASQVPSTPANKLDLVVHSVLISKGKLTLVENSEGASKPRELDQVNIELKDFSTTAAFPFGFSGHIGGAGDLKLEGKAGPINTTDAALTPATVHYSLTGFDLAASTLFDASTGIRGLVAAEGDLEWKGTAVEVKGVVRADKLILAKDGTPAKTEVQVDFAVNHNVVHHSGQVTRGGIHIGKAVANVTGTYALRGAVPSVVLGLVGTKMPIDELTAIMPALAIQLPQGSSIKGGTATLQASSQGPLNNLVTKGTLSIDGTSLQNFDLGTKMKVMEALAGLHAGANTEFQKIALSLTRTNQGTTLENMQITAPAVGELSGSGTVGSKNELALKMKINLHTSGGLIAAATGYKGGDTGGLPFSVTGTIENPVIRPEMKAVAQEVAKQVGKQAAQEAGKAATGFLNNLLNGKKKQQ